MRISDWSSDVCSSDLLAEVLAEEVADAARLVGNDRKGRIVAHAADRFLGVFHHGAEDQFHILQRAPGRDLAAHQLGPLEPLGGLGPVAALQPQKTTSKQSRVGKKWVNTVQSRW